MSALVKFNIRDIDKEEIKVMMRAFEYQSALEDIYNFCRGNLKHTDFDDDDPRIRLLEIIKDKIPNIWD